MGVRSRLRRPAPDDDATILHVLSRLTWGPRPEDLAAVRTMGLDRWIDRQLHPEAIEDKVTEQVLAPLRTLSLPSAELLARYEYPRGAKREMQATRARLKADLGLEMAFAEMGGWDTHAGQPAQQAGRLRELGAALAAFHDDLGPRLGDVVLVTLTEFGRTVRENGNRGTDHGHGSVSFVLGGPVKGGRVHGRWPGLKADDLYEGRDLAVTTDFRDLLGELLVGHLEVGNLGSVFPDHTVDRKHFPGVLRG